jgi:TPR repeat protein
MKNHILKFVDHLLHPVDLNDHNQVIKEATRLLERNNNFQEALELLKPVAESGNALAQTITGGIYRELKMLPDHNGQALRWFEKAAAQGFDLGELNLGIMHMDGLGCPKDPALAARWFRVAADKGHPLGQFELAHLIIRGELDGTTLEEAIFLLELAINQNFTPAMNELAKLYEHKTASEAHKKRAMELRHTAAALGDHDSKLYLGEKLYQQSEDTQNQNEYLHLLEEAATYGYTPALCRLGTIYNSGLGVAPDRQKAASYWSIAAEQGHEESRINLEQMQHAERNSEPRTMENTIPHVPRIG